MSKYIVRCVFNGTGKTLAISASCSAVALAKAIVSRQSRGANAFIVYERKSKSPVLTYFV